MEKKGTLCLPGHGLGQQGFAGARRAHQQHALGQLGADGGVLLRLVEEVHHLHQGLLGLVLAGHVGKGDAGGGLLHVDLGVGLAEGHGIAHAPGQAAIFFIIQRESSSPQEDKDKDGQNPAHQDREDGVGLGGDFSGKLDVLVFPQLTEQPLSVVGPDTRLVDGLAAALIRGQEHDLPVGLVQGHLGHLARVHHVQELAVGHLVHLPLQHGGEQEHIEEHQHDQGHQHHGQDDNRNDIGKKASHFHRHGLAGGHTLR